MTANNPNITDVASAQGSGVFTAINDARDAVEAGQTSGVAVALGSGTSTTMNSATFWSGNLFSISGTQSPDILTGQSPDDIHAIIVPAESRGVMSWENNTAYDISVSISGQSVTPPIIPAGGKVLLKSDGTNVELAGLAFEGVRGIIVLTQAEYDALDYPDGDMLYFTT